MNPAATQNKINNIQAYIAAHSGISRICLAYEIWRNSSKMIDDNLDYYNIIVLYIPWNFHVSPLLHYLAAVIHFKFQSWDISGDTLNLGKVHGIQWN